MTERYEGLLIDSCPQRRRLTEVTAGLAALPGCPRLWPGVIPRASQNPSPARGHMSSYTSCAVAKPFPITQAHASLYPVCHLNPSPFGPRLFLVILTQHTVTHAADLLFFFSPFSRYTSSLECACAYACVCVFALHTQRSPMAPLYPPCQSSDCSSPDTSVSVSSAEARGNEELGVY